ncbi:hypothetical protein D3C76_1231780 [compost metagenome]
MEPLPKSVKNAPAVGTRIMNGCTRIAIAISFISLASIFRPRNSGVLPTISPHKKTPMMAYISILISPTPFPPKTLLSIIRARGVMPPSGVSVSCILLTLPVVAAVVTEVNSEDCGIPKRTSLPSMLPCEDSIPSALIAGLPLVSA